MTGRIVEEALGKVKTLIPNIDSILVDQIVLGLGYTGVKLSDGHAGLCYTFQTEIAQAASHCQVSDLAGTLAGSPAIKLAEKAKSSDIKENIIGFSVLNALSQIVIDQNPQRYQIVDGDIIDHVTLTKTDTVVLVGYICPLVPRLRANSKKLYILERTASHRDQGILPDTACYNILPTADVALITGTAIANGTIDHLLELAKNAREIAIIGATAGILPDVLFDHGVTLVGGARVTNADKMLQIVSEGGGTPALKSAIKFVTIKRSK
ncbi:MAG: Rossmann-like domain-containing protein [Candidatus Bathyarchaeia archaeon]|jgi:uncharacterized protein (DUF4213/DUF364 family)